MRAAAWGYLLLFTISLVLLGSPVLGANPASPIPRHALDEAEIQARLEREQNPVKRAKYEMQLGQVKFEQAVNAYGKQEFEQGVALLEAYLHHLQGAWKLLESSGRSAVKRPEGFRELDIELREDARRIEDLAHQTPYDLREPIEKVELEVDHIRNQVLSALFPSEAPAATAKKSPRTEGTPAAPGGGPS
jgi:hypothetical protein